VPGGMTNGMTAPGFHTTVSSSGGALKATACSGRHDGQRARRPAGIGSDLGQLLMKGVMAVLIKIQRQVHGRDQPLFRRSGTIGLNPGDRGVVSHPSR
jgi:hypothetical protein